MIELRAEKKHRGETGAQEISVFHWTLLIMDVPFSPFHTTHWRLQGISLQPVDILIV